MNDSVIRIMGFIEIDDVVAEGVANEVKSDVADDAVSDGEGDVNPVKSDVVDDVVAESEGDINAVKSDVGSLKI